MNVAAGGNDTAVRGGSAAAKTQRFVTRPAGDVEWTIHEALADRLLGEAGLRWAEWTAPHAASVVKTGPHRTVYRLDLPAGEFYLKQFRLADWKALLRNLVRTCPAEIEWQAAHRIAACGLPTFETIAMGRRMRAGVVCENYLVTRGIPGALPLDQFWQSVVARISAARQAIVRQQLAGVLGRLTARLHRSGVEHADFHAGNLLVVWNGSDLPELFVIDLNAARFHRVLAPAARRRNLALLYRSMALIATLADRLRFFQAYSAELSAAAADRDEINRLEAACRASAHAGWRRADRAWRRGNRHVRQLDTPATGCRGLAVLDAQRLAMIRDNPESLFAEQLDYWCKRSGRHRVAAVTPLLQGSSSLAFWKCIDYRSWYDRLLGRFRESAVRRGWEIGHAFLRRGIATPMPLLFVEARGPGLRRDYLLTEAVRHSTTLAEFCAAQWPRLLPVQQRHWKLGLTRRLALQLRRLHECRYDHRDLKFQNILVSQDPAADAVWLLDLDAVRAWPWRSRSRAVQNLARLNVSSLMRTMFQKTDRLRFLKTYLGVRFAAEWRNWWRAIACRSRKKQYQNQHRGRPLT